MDKKIFESMREQMQPDDAVINELLEKAANYREKNICEDLVKDKGGIIMKENKSNDILKTGGFKPLIAAAVIVLVMGVGVCLNIASNRLSLNSGSQDAGSPGYYSETETDRTTLYNAQKESDTTTQLTMQNTVSNDEITVYSDDSQAISKSVPAEEPQKHDPPSTVATTVTTAPSPDEIPDEQETADMAPKYVDDEYAAWQPDPEEYEYPDGQIITPEPDEDGTVKDIAQVPSFPIDELFKIEWNGLVYTSINSNFAKAQNYSADRSIPNDSYIGEQLDSVQLTADNGKIYNAGIYAVRYTFDDLVIALKFDESPRYFLYMNLDFEYDTFYEFLLAMDFEKYVISGDVMNRDNYYNFKTIDSGELLEKTLMLSGESCQHSSDENVWQSFFSSPLYGSAITFKWYPDGVVEVVTDESVHAYYVGQDSTAQIINYINMSEEIS